MRTVRCSGRRGCVSQHTLGRGCLPGGCLPQCMLGYTPLLWTEFLTHACENITFPQLLLRTVKININLLEIMALALRIS